MESSTEAGGGDLAPSIEFKRAGKLKKFDIQQRKALMQCAVKLMEIYLDQAIKKEYWERQQGFIKKLKRRIAKNERQFASVKAEIKQLRKEIKELKASTTRD